MDAFHLAMCPGALLAQQQEHELVGPLAVVAKVIDRVVTVKV